MKTSGFIKTMIGLALALTWTGCTEDETNQAAADRTALGITAGSQTAGSEQRAAETRATDTGWSNGDAIGVYMLGTGTGNPSDSNAPAEGFRYINMSADGPTAGFDPADEDNTAYFPTGKGQVDVVAYYPYNQLTTDNGQLAIDVTDQAYLPVIDLMTSALATGHSSDAPQVGLTFTHRLAKVVVGVGSGLGEVTSLAIAGTATTATYDLLGQRLTAGGTVADIAIPTPATGATATAIVVPTAAGSGVQFKLTAGGHDYTATLPAEVALGAGMVTTVNITPGATDVDISATIEPWTDGPTTSAGAVFFKLPDNPETGVPTVTAFRLWKNDDEAGGASYTYADGKWNATPSPFFVEDIATSDVFYARHTPAATEADAVTGLTDVLEAGPATMDSRGVIPLEFGHVNAQLTVLLYAGDGLPADTDLTTAVVKLFGATLAGSDTDAHIYAPVTIATGGTLAVVEVGGNTYTALAAADFVLAAGTRNTLSLTVKVETTGQRIVVPEVTTRDWVGGIDEDVEAVRFVPAVDPSTGVPAVTAFTVMKNGINPTLYSYDLTNDKWSATPDFFKVEDIISTDVFTARAEGAADAISGLTDVLEAGPATMDDQGIIDLEFVHTRAQLSIRLYAGDGMPADTDLTTAVVVYEGISYSGDDKTFVIEPRQFAANDIIVSVTVGGSVYESKLTSPLTFAAGTDNVLNITLKVVQEGKTVAAMNATQKDWTVLPDVGLDAINTVMPQHPSGEHFEVDGFVMVKNPGIDAMKVRYVLDDSNPNEKKYVPVGTPFYVEDITASDVFYARHEPTVSDPATGAKDILTAGPVSMAGNTVSMTFDHAMAQVEFVIKRDASFTQSVTGAKVLVKKLVDKYSFADDNAMTPEAGVSDYNFDAGAVYTVVPQTVATGDLSVSLNGHTYAASGGFAATAGDKLTITLTLLPSSVGISAELGSWNNASGSATVKQDILAQGMTFTNAPGDGELRVGTGSVGGVYRYTHATQEFTATTPLYWDDLTGTTFDFTATFTPDAVGNPEKDVLSGSAAGVGYGAAIDFGELAHVNAKLKLTLKAGTGYTDADMTATTLSVTGLTSLPTSMTAGTEYIFTAKTLEATDVITVTTTIPATTTTPATTATYTLKMTDITVGGNPLAELAGGSSYTVELTVSKSGIGVAIDVKDWTVVDGGSGSVGYN